MTHAQTDSGPRFTVHDRCLKARKDAGLEQVQLAETIEVSRQTISNYETGRITRPTRPTLRRWALACGVTFDWLVDGDYPKVSGGDTPDGDTSKKRGNSTRSNRSGPGRKSRLGRTPEGIEHPGMERAS